MKNPIAALELIDEKFAEHDKPMNDSICRLCEGCAQLGYACHEMHFGGCEFEIVYRALKQREELIECLQSVSDCCASDTKIERGSVYHNQMRRLLAKVKGETK